MENYSDPELRAWLRRHIKRGKGQHMGNDKDAEFPSLEFCRLIRWDQRDLNEWINATAAYVRPIPPHVRRRMLHFIRLWDDGMLDVIRGTGKQHARKIVVRRAEPKPMPMRLKVDVSTRQLSFVPKRPPPVALPHLRPKSNILDRLAPL
jgi:hypothetical protein